METTVHDKQTTWERYAAAWREPTADGKQAALSATVEPSCTYRDPLTVADGHRALIDYMLAFHQQVPGGHFVTTYFLAHHDRSIAKWNMVDRTGTVIGHGVSYGEYSAHGKLAAITGFFDDGRDARPAGSAAEEQRGSIDGRDLRPAGSAAEGQRGSIDVPPT